MTITYQLANDEGELCSIRRKVDGVIKGSIPIDSANTEYQKYLTWVAEGNTADAAD